MKIRVTKTPVAGEYLHLMKLSSGDYSTGTYVTECLMVQQGTSNVHISASDIDEMFYGAYHSSISDSVLTINATEISEQTTLGFLVVGNKTSLDFLDSLSLSAAEANVLAGAGLTAEKLANLVQVISGYALINRLANLTASKVVVTNSDSQLEPSEVTVTELNTLRGINYSIPTKVTQIESKLTNSLVMCNTNATGSTIEMYYTADENDEIEITEADIQNALNLENSLANSIDHKTFAEVYERQADSGSLRIFDKARSNVTVGAAPNVKIKAQEESTANGSAWHLHSILIEEVDAGKEFMVSIPVKIVNLEETDDVTIKTRIITDNFTGSTNTGVDKIYAVNGMAFNVIVTNISESATKDLLVTMYGVIGDSEIIISNEKQLFDGESVNLSLSQEMYEKIKIHIDTTSSEEHTAYSGSIIYYVYGG